MVRSAACILLSVILFAPLGVWLYCHVSDSADERERTAKLLAFPEGCLPEPGERSAFLASVACLPILIFGSIFVCHRWGPIRDVVVPIFVARGVKLGLSVLLPGICWWAFKGDKYYLLRGNLFFEHPLWTLSLLAISIGLIASSAGKRSGVRLAVDGMAFGLLACVFLTSLFNESGGNARSEHFTAVFDPVLQVHLGKALLINYASQYGLYPHFLQPVFAIGGLSVFRFTLVMGALLAVSYALLWWFLRQALHDQFVALFGFAALVCNSCLVYFDDGLGRTADTAIDRYFQYLPIRFVFPAVLVALAWSYFRSPRRWKYWATTTFMAAGVLWNLDSGLPAFIAWLGVLGYAELWEGGARATCGRIAQHVVAGALILAAVVAICALLMYLLYGQFPHGLQFLRYQRLFYISGFGMLPMPFQGTWVAVILVYLAGLAYAAHAVATRQRDVRANMVFLLSILGVGLFTYYQGRSHPLVLVLAWWPCFPLLALFLDDLVFRWREHSLDLLQWTVLLLLVCVLAGSTWGLKSRWRELNPAVAKDLRAILHSGPSPVEQEVALLKRMVSPGEAVFVVPMKGIKDADCVESLCHLGSRMPSPSHAPFVQMLATQDFVELCEVLDKRREVKVFVQNGIRAILAGRPGPNQLFQLLDAKYETVATTDRGCLLARRAEGQHNGP